MWIEYLFYIVAFIISCGMSALGIMLSLQFFQSRKTNVFATLLYYQIFLFSFLIYSIWGNIAFHIVLDDLNLNPEVTTRLTFFFPMIGIPFMLVAWFMLIRFSILINGHKVNKLFSFGFFPTMVVLFFVLDLLIHQKIILIPDNSELFVVRILTGLNLAMHLAFLLPFLKKVKSSEKLFKHPVIEKFWPLFFIGGTLIYSTVLSFHSLWGFATTCVAIILLFGVSAFIPSIIQFFGYKEEPKKNMDFEAFCKLYEISKRETEIIMEICTGKTNKAIAEKLFITLQTVKDHTHRIYTKTGVKSRVQLANLVREKTGSKMGKED